MYVGRAERHWVKVEDSVGHIETVWVAESCKISWRRWNDGGWRSIGRWEISSTGAGRGCETALAQSLDPVRRVATPTGRSYLRKKCKNVTLVQSCLLDISAAFPVHIEHFAGQCCVGSSAVYYLCPNVMRGNRASFTFLSYWGFVVSELLLSPQIACLYVVLTTLIKQY